MIPKLCTAAPEGTTANSKGCHRISPILPAGIAHDLAQFMMMVQLDRAPGKKGDEGCPNITI